MTSTTSKTFVIETPSGNREVKAARFEHDTQTQRYKLFDSAGEEVASFLNVTAIYAKDAADGAKS
jgi:hypothetical protein